MAEAERRLAVFPAFHKVEGRRVVIVGQGEAAAAKVRLVGETSAEIVLVAPVLDLAAGADLIRAGGHWLPRAAEPADFAGAALAFIASGDAAEDARIAAMARAAGVAVNVVDRPDLCDFYTPALVNRAPLSVAICTEGAAPVLARHVRARIEAVLAPSFGDLARLAGRLRGRVAESLAEGPARRRFWARFFSGSVAAKVAAGRLDEAEADALASLDGASEVGSHVSLAGHVSLVGAGPGAEDLLTLRAQRLLQEADVIVFDRLVPEKVVAMGRRDAERVYVGKAKGHHVATQDEINRLLVAHARAGRHVVRLKSGDPLVFGRAGEEMAALREAGIPFDVVPGITAAIAAAAEHEIPLTLRGAASSVVFATGHDAAGDTLPDWAGLALTGATVAVYMGYSVAAAVARRLVEAGLDPATPVALIENASRHDSRAFGGRLDELGRVAARAAGDGPALIIIGEVVASGAAHLRPASLRDLAAA